MKHIKLFEEFNWKFWEWGDDEPYDRGDGSGYDFGRQKPTRPEDYIDGEWIQEEEEEYDEIDPYGEEQWDEREGDNVPTYARKRR